MLTPPRATTRLGTIAATLLTTTTALVADTVLVSNRADGTVSCLNPDSGQLVRSIDVGLGTHEFAVSPDGRTLVGSCYGSGPSHQVPDNRLFVIDLVHPDRITILDLGDHPRPNDLRFLPDGQRLVVTSEQRDQLLIVSLESGDIEHAIPLTLGTAHMLTLAPDGTRAYVPSVATGQIAVVDLAADPPAKTDSVRCAPGAEGIDITPDGRWLWVACNRSSSIHAVDTDSLDVVADIPADGFPFRVRCLPDNETVAVSHPMANEVRLYDVETHACTVRVPVPGGPTSLAVSPDGTRVYAVCANRQAVVGINAADGTIVDEHTTGPTPDALAITDRSMTPG